MTGRRGRLRGDPFAGRENTTSTTTTTKRRVQTFSTASRKSCGPFSPCRAPTPNRTAYAALCKGSICVSAARVPEIHRLAATIEVWWRRSKRPSSPATPTLAPRAATGSRNTKTATHSASATPSTNAAAYARPAPANTGGCQPSPPSCPVKRDEPVADHELVRRLRRCPPPR